MIDPNLHGLLEAMRTFFTQQQTCKSSSSLSQHQVYNGVQIHSSRRVHDAWSWNTWWRCSAPSVPDPWSDQCWFHLHLSPGAPPECHWAHSWTSGLSLRKASCSSPWRSLGTLEFRSKTSHKLAASQQTATRDANTRAKSNTIGYRRSCSSGHPLQSQSRNHRLRIGSHSQGGCLWSPRSWWRDPQPGPQLSPWTCRPSCKLWSGAASSTEARRTSACTRHSQRHPILHLPAITS